MNPAFFLDILIDKCLQIRNQSPTTVEVGLNFWKDFCIFIYGRATNTPTASVSYRGVKIVSDPWALPQQVRLSHFAGDQESYDYNIYHSLPVSAARAYINVSPLPSMGGYKTSGPPPLTKSGFHQAFSEMQISFSNPPALKCGHKWKQYVGFTNTFEYCINCDEKRGHV